MDQTIIKYSVLKYYTKYFSNKNCVPFIYPKAFNEKIRFINFFYFIPNCENHCTLLYMHVSLWYFCLTARMKCKRVSISLPPFPPSLPPYPQQYISLWTTSNSSLVYSEDHQRESLASILGYTGPRFDSQSLILRIRLQSAMHPEGADHPPFLYACSEDRYKSFERGIYPPPPHWDRREILAKP